ncbi:MAG TPA: hypothetical protein DDY49_02255 [Paenibacillaceae bacterium]|nr:hypothetical protein [Paenibacillaceae bacterium]
MKRLVAIIISILLLILCGCHAIIANRLHYVKSVTLYDYGNTYSIPQNDTAFNRIVRQTEDIINKPLSVCKCGVPSKEDLARNTTQGIIIELEKPIQIKIKEIDNPNLREDTMDSLWISLDPEQKQLATMNQADSTLYGGKKNCFMDIQKTASIYLQKERK